MIPVAEGTEEIEFSTIFDVLVRCGLEALVLAVAPVPEVRLSRGLVVRAPNTLAGHLSSQYGGDVVRFAESLDAVLLPGGMPGASNLRDSLELQTILASLNSAKKLVGAICASPAVVLAKFGILSESSVATCYPGMRNVLSDFGVKWIDTPVAFDSKSNVLTSQGPGTTLGFALAASALLVGDAVAIAVNADLLTNWGSVIESVCSAK